MKKQLVVVAILAAACGAEKQAQAPETPQPLVLATFTGEVDPVAGTFTVQSEPTALGHALGVAALVIPSGTPGVTLANVAASAWTDAAGHCTVPANSSGGQVTIHSNYTSSGNQTNFLRNVYAELTSVSVTGAAACNSAAAIPGVSAALGLWSYGDITASTTTAGQDWAFNRFNGGQAFSFVGRVVAFKMDVWTDQIPRVDGTWRYAAGSANQVVFKDAVAANTTRVIVVNSTGTPTTSGAATAVVNGVAVDKTSERIWVSLQAASIAYFGSTVTAAPTAVTIDPGGTGNYAGGASITVDPNGTVWVTRNAGTTPRIFYYVPAGGAQGYTTIGGATTTPPVLVAATQGADCYVYAQTSNTTMSRVTCTAPLAATPPVTSTFTGFATPCLSAMSGGVAATNGDVYFLGQNTAGTQGTICKVVGTTVTNVVNDAGALYTGLAFDADGYLWTSRGTSLIRYQVTPSVVATTVVGTQTPTNVVLGAGALWGPSSGGTNLSNLTRVVP
jgi:hypothetical protein